MSRKAFRYAVVRHRGHTRANSQGQVLAHLVIAEHALGKPLPPSAEVHHVDGNPTNNAHSNLVICEDRLYHKLLHYRQKVRAHGGDPNIHRLCCSGIEAATVAWHPLGFQAVAVSEIDPFPCAVLAHHYPSVAELGRHDEVPGLARCSNRSSRWWNSLPVLLRRRTPQGTG
jgi:hypothetical protein